jgi:hypothetical protein
MSHSHRHDFANSDITLSLTLKNERPTNIMYSIFEPQYHRISGLEPFDSNNYSQSIAIKYHLDATDDISSPLYARSLSSFCLSHTIHSTSIFKTFCTLHRTKITNQSPLTCECTRRKPVPSMSVPEHSRPSSESLNLQCQRRYRPNRQSFHHC